MLPFYVYLFPSYDKAAKETGVSIPTIERYMALLNLALAIQEKVATSDGFVGISALSKLAETFSSPVEQEQALEEIGGFKQSIQLEILKRSDGNMDKLTELKAQAMEGAFNARMCMEGFCFILPTELKEEIKKMLEENQDLSSLKDVVKKLK